MSDVPHPLHLPRKGKSQQMSSFWWSESASYPHPQPCWSALQIPTNCTDILHWEAVHFYLEAALDPVHGIKRLPEHHRTEGLRWWSSQVHWALHEALLQQEACQTHKPLALCWLDLANAFGSVHYQRICFSLKHYHAPASMITAVSNLYQGLLELSVHTEERFTNPFPVEVAVFQGDCWISYRACFWRWMPPSSQGSGWILFQVWYQ